MHKHLRWLLAVLLAFTLVASACGDDDGGGDAAPVDAGDGGTTPDEATPDDAAEPPADAGEPQLGGEIVVGLNSDTASYYPPEGSWVTTGPLLPSRSMFDTFTRYSENGEIRMELAESLEPTSEDDFTKWTLKVREGVMFHDGTPLNADAIVQIYDLWHDATNFAPTGIDFATKIDEYTVELNLFLPDPELGVLLSANVGAPFSPTAALAENAGPANKPVGTGPYMFESWTRDSELVVVPNPNYWRTDFQPKLDRIRFRTLSDRDTRQASLRSGDIHIDAEHGVEGLADLQSDGFQVFPSSGNDSRTVMFNVRVPPLDDERVRRSLAHTLNPEDRKAIEAVLPGQEFFIRDQFYAPGHPWHVEGAAKNYAFFDLEMAQQLHDEYMNDPNRSDGKAAGEPISFSYQCNADPTLFLAAQLFQSEWGEIGYDVSLEQLEQATLLQGYLGGPTDEPAPWTGTFQAACNAEGGNGDPAIIYRNKYGNPDVQIGNIMNYNTPAINDAIDVLASTRDVDTRKEAIRVIEDDVSQAMAWVYGPSISTAFAASPNLHGIDDWTYMNGDPADRLVGGDLYWPAIWLDQS